MIELHVTADSVSKRVGLVGQKTVFGRTQAADVILNWDTMVSSRHFQIDAEDGYCVLTDLDSTNGTRLNGNIVQRSTLRLGDEIQVGHTTLRIVPREMLDAAGQTPVASQASAATGGMPNHDVNHDVNHSGARHGDADDEADDDGALLETERQASPLVASGKAGNNDIHDGEGHADGVDLPRVDAAKRIVQVCLRVTSETRQGQVFWFGADNMLVVGRSAMADCVFADDSYMSSEHCRLECTLASCHVEDLQSRGGTWLNGEAVKRAQIFDGDHLRVGSTEFIVELVGEAGQRLAPPENRSLVGAAAMRNSQPASGVQIEAIRTAVNGELISVVGKLSDTFTPVSLVKTLAQLGKVVLIMDFSRIGVPPPDSMNLGESTLFPWLPGESVRELPMLVALEEWGEWSDGVEEAWGCDAVEILCGPGGKSSLIGDLRDLMCKTGPIQGIVGLCWPSILRALLATEGEERTARLFDRITLTACETADPAAWQITGKAKAIEKLESLGFKLIEPAKRRDQEQPGEEELTN